MDIPTPTSINTQSSQDMINNLPAPKKSSRLRNSIPFYIKIVAFILFITLPLFGFFLGIRYQQNITNRENSQKTAILAKLTQPPEPTVPYIDKNHEPTGCSTYLGVNPYNNRPYKVELSQNKGFCKVSIPLSTSSEYSLEFPESWHVNSVGLNAANLVFNREVTETTYTYDLSVILMSTNLDLQDTDKATFTWDLSTEPMVDPKEIIKSKEILNVGNKQCLVLLTSFDAQTIKRYFLINKEARADSYNLYVFEIKKNTQEFDSEKTKKLIGTVEEMIDSLEFF